MILIIDIWDIDFILDIDDDFIKISEKWEILDISFDFRDIMNWEIFEVDFFIVKDKIDISENQEIVHDSLNSWDISEWMSFRIDFGIIIDEIYFDIIRRI